MNLFGGKNKKEMDEYFGDGDDRLIVFDTDKRTTDVVYVTEVTADAVISHGKYKVPKTDCEVYTSPEGRVYVMKTTTPIVTETERLAKLEISTVLSQITSYKAPVKENPNLDMKFWAVVGLLFVAIIMAAF